MLVRWHAGTLASWYVCTQFKHLEFDYAAGKMMPARTGTHGIGYEMWGIRAACERLNVKIVCAGHGRLAHLHTEMARTLHGALDQPETYTAAACGVSYPIYVKLIISSPGFIQSNDGCFPLVVFFFLFFIHHFLIILTAGLPATTQSRFNAMSIILFACQNMGSMFSFFIISSDFLHFSDYHCCCSLSVSCWKCYFNI
jgi:hypothetical protein